MGPKKDTGVFWGNGEGKEDGHNSGDQTQKEIVTITRLEKRPPAVGKKEKTTQITPQKEVKV